MAYQNVSFSAGETLTATKMNQMTANDAAFHDGTGIADGAITADKIDLATFIKFGPGRNNITLSDETELASVTVPSSGNYVILAVGGISGGNSDFVTWGLYKNSTMIGELFTDQVTRPHASLITQSYLNQDDTVSFRCTADGAQTLTRPNGVCIIKLS